MFARKAIHYFGRALRESGQALDRLGLVVAENEIFRETFTRHRKLMTIMDKVTRIFAQMYNFIVRSETSDCIRCICCSKCNSYW
jgi:hypothetical protein